MSNTVEPVVRKWYDALEEGKILGMRCKKCGSYEFPPVPLCNSCGCMDMEWAEMKGVGTLISCEVDNMPIWPYESFGPVMAGYVQLEEGPAFITWIVGVADEDRDSMPEQLPLDVEFEIQQRDGFKYPVVHILK